MLNFDNEQEPSVTLLNLCLLLRISIFATEEYFVHCFDGDSNNLSGFRLLFQEPKCRRRVAIFHLQPILATTDSVQ